MARRLRVRILATFVWLVGPAVVAPPPAHSQAGFTPDMARDQLDVLLSGLGDWHGLAVSRYGQSAWSLLRNGSGALTLLAQDSALAGHEVRLELRAADLKASDEAGYRVHIRDPQGETQFDLHLHDGIPGAPGGGHVPVLCPDEAGVGCLDIHGSGDGRAFEAAWSSNGELRWLVAYQDTRAHVDSVLGVGRSSEDRTFERAVLSLSGGISYGSYQAGVNWAMIDMLKRLKYGNLSRRTDSHDFSNLSLAAATGASAGNINALFSALEWCDRDFIPPERSLFFRTWANIGFTQLLPEAHYREHSSIRDSTGTALPDSALFTRRFFKAVPFRSIEEKVVALSAGQARNTGDCNTPIGVTLTKLLPGSLHLGLPPDTIPIDTQRYTTVFELRTPDFQGGRANVGFAQPDLGLFQDRTIGKWMLIDTPSPDISVLDVLSVVEAASAYPVAFAPITLSYIDDDLGDCGTLRGGRCVREGQFMDGGIFDNNPLAVAFALLRRQQTRSDPSDVATQLDHLSDLLMNRVFYIDPGRTRGELRTLETDRDEERIFGLDVLKEMIKGGIPTARKYELQSVARFGSIVDQSWIRVTDRAAPVFGQSLGAFGAFLGRPLRVHDFYVGAYDGMRMVAREALCNPAANTTIGFAPNLVAEGGPSGTGIGRTPEYDAEQCLAQALDSLITQSDSIPSHGRLIMADVYRRDFPAVQGPAVNPPEAHTSAPHDRIAAATLLAAEALKMAARNSSACDPGLRVFDRLLCKEGIIAAVKVLRPHLEAVPMATGRRNPKCDRDVAAVEIMADECVADDWFVNFVRSPGQAMSTFVERLMRQLWRVQNTYDPAEVSATETLIELPEFYYRSVIQPQYRELGALPKLIHTLPGKPERKATALYFMPEEISALSQNNGWRFQVAKQAGWDWGPRWVTPITLAYQYGFGAATGTQLESRLGLARKGTGIFLSRWGIDGIWGWDYETDSYFYGAQLDFYLAAGKFHIAPRWVDWPDRDFDWLPRQVAFGLSDVSGMIYWLARLGIF